MFSKILIANRGEIAVRVIRTAKRLGIKTVAVYSEADQNSPHVDLADEAFLIGPPPAAQSYLDMNKVLETALASGAEAIHPGYGFLSENAEFAQLCADNEIVFIGPKPDTIRAMGSKSSAKGIMRKANVPVLPGYDGEQQDPEILLQQAKEIGFPVLLKASAGGGGKGMRLVESENDFADGLASAKRESKASFADDHMLVEKYLNNPRHIEVQVFADHHDHYVHLFERDCSVQRRHQKVIEEAPAPDLPKDVRQRLLTAGVEAAKAVDYVGAGTVEFLFDGDTNVYFMEMNTRLQVEHPVTEAITGIDLVEWQLRVAYGEPLPKTQQQINEKGHSMEARLYAENPDNDFLPSTGHLETLLFPENCRVDTGVRQGQTISTNYDPMIAKVITFADTREQAAQRLSDALAGIRVHGLETNCQFLYRITSNPSFKQGQVSTNFIPQHKEALFAKDVSLDLALSAAVIWLKDSTWSTIQPGFRLNGLPEWQHWIHVGDEHYLLTVQNVGNCYRIQPFTHASALDRKDGLTTVRLPLINAHGNCCNNEVRVTLDNQQFTVGVTHHDQEIKLWWAGRSVQLFIDPPGNITTKDSEDGGSLTAPMPGTIIEQPLEQNQTVSKGDVLLVMEAMKMEHAIKAPQDGTLVSYHFQPGDLVSQGATLVEFAPTEEN